MNELPQLSFRSNFNWDSTINFLISLDIIFKSPFPDLLRITKGMTVQSTNKADTNNIDVFIVYFFKLFHSLIAFPCRINIRHGENSKIGYLASLELLKKQF